MARRQQPESPIPPVNETAEHHAFLLYVSSPELTLEEIAAMVGENANTVRVWKFRRKWDKGLAEIRSMLAARRPPKEEPHVLAAVESRDEIAKDYEGNMQRAAKKFGKHVVTMEPEEMLEHAPKIDAMDKVNGRRLKLDEPETAGHGGHISLTFLGAAAEGSVRIIDATPKKLLDSVPALALENRRAEEE